MLFEGIDRVHPRVTGMLKGARSCDLDSRVFPLERFASSLIEIMRAVHRNGLGNLVNSMWGTWLPVDRPCRVDGDGTLMQSGC